MTYSIRQIPLRLSGMISGLLLFTAFPPMEWSAAGWFALFPLLAACAFLPPRAAARQGWVAGLTAWLLSLFWLTRVSWAAWIGLSAYCALYTAVFAAAFAWWFRSCAPDTGRTFFAPVFSAPAIWVSLEYLRSTLFTGFPWNTLAVSQYARPELAQSAAWGGVYIVAFLMVLPSSLLLVLFVAPPASLRWWRPCLVAGGMVAVLWGAYAAAAPFRAAPSGAGGVDLDVALAQLNVPQNVKWEDEWSGDIYRRLRDVTLKILSDGDNRPDLVVWPETVMPDFFRGNYAAMAILEKLLESGTPILAGSMDWEEHVNGMRYYNSSFLLTSGGGLDDCYAKRHLVMFGEYLPLEKFIPWLRSLSPIGENFTPGAEARVFTLDNGAALAPLICFEDIIPGLARASVRNGGRLLVNQTNDAWFDPLAAARQHMAHCVFRCIENRTPAVRAANTGITCFIDRHGRIIAELPRVTKHPAPPTHLRHAMRVPPAEMSLTFYTRHGDLFAWGCLLYALAGLLPTAVSFSEKTARCGDRALPFCRYLPWVGRAHRARRQE